VKRRFPKAIRAGIYGMKQLQQQHKRHWISPISKLEELFHNPFLTEQRLQKRVEIKIQPASAWKPLKYNMGSSSYPISCLPL